MVDRDTVKEETGREEMAEKMNAIQYEKCGGGPAGLKVPSLLLLLLIKCITAV